MLTGRHTRPLVSLKTRATTLTLSFIIESRRGKIRIGKWL
jgi:hypothetical protein